MSEATVASVLREVYAVTEGEAPIPVEAVERIAAEHGIDLREPCDTCHAIEGHETWCPEGLCRTCEIQGCPGDCADRAYERWADT